MARPFIFEDIVIDYLRLSITDRCNLRCLYCMPAQGVPLKKRDEILSFEEILKILPYFQKLGLQKIRITGGEPLIRKGLLPFLFKLCQMGFKQGVSITTNGTLLAEYAKELFRLGISRLNVSLDSLNSDTFKKITRGGSLATVLNGLQAAKSAGFSPIKLNTVVLAGINTPEILDIIRFSSEMGLIPRFIEYMPIGVSPEELPAYYVSNETIYQAISAEYTLTPTDYTKGFGPSAYYRLGPKSLTSRTLVGKDQLLGLISPISHNFCQACNRLRLQADGNLRLCLNHPQKLSVKNLLGQGLSDSQIRGALTGFIAQKSALKLTADGCFTRQRMCQIGG